MKNLIRTTLLYTCLIALIAGCGGGGGNGDKTPPPVDDPPPPALSSDATLSDLQASAAGFDQAFSSGLESYTGTVDNTITSTTVSATTADSSATIMINSVAASSGVPSDPISLAEGSNQISISVTAEDGATTKTYTIDVSRLAAPVLSSDATLSDLQISATVFDQVFQSNMEAYTGTAAFLASSTTVTATSNDANASFTINGEGVASGVQSDSIELVEGSNILTVVVTAEDGATNKTYTIDVTRDAGAVFAQQAYVKASNTGANDAFGISVALSGNTLAVGARGEYSAATGVNGNQLDNSEPNAGAVYVFTRDPAGVWSQHAYIKAPTVNEDDLFGLDVALDGDTLVVGASGDDSAATGINGDQSDNSAFYAGAVHVFTRDGSGNWSQQAYLKASNAESADGFGYSVALSGNTLAVGAYNEDSSSTGVNGDQGNYELDPNEQFPPLGSGAAYIFTRDGSGWRWARMQRTVRPQE
jgi:hypothetical protein